MRGLPASWTTDVCAGTFVNYVIPHSLAHELIDGSTHIFLGPCVDRDNCRDRLCGIFSEGDKRDSKHGTGNPMTLPRSQHLGLGPRRFIVIPVMIH